jgi:hypothetical protein
VKGIWLHSIMKIKSASVTAAMNTSEDVEEDGMVNMAMECSNKGWKTPDAA